MDIGATVSDVRKEYKDFFVRACGLICIPILPEINSKAEVEYQQRNTDQYLDVTPVNHMQGRKSAKHAAPNDPLMKQNSGKQETAQPNQNH